MRPDELKKLHQKKYRDQFGYYLVEGEHLVLELQKAAARNPRLKGVKVYVTQEREQWRTPFEKHVLSNRHMDQIAETQTPQGIVALVPILPPAPPQAAERGIYLYEIQDPGNLGTILRTLAWFGNFRCLLSPGSVDPFNSKVLRASAGAIFHVPVEVDVALSALADRFTRIAALDMQGETLGGEGFAQAQCLVFGNEARGIPREELAKLGARSWTIAGSGAIESLNVAAAVNMCAYELNRR
ncbi:MAG TPA: RNA methyltransferase [Povalibacter sp.]|jgi:TrmH family RNA methyltransferase|nr:RNA methyltransferase [Povalibacter sp.]